MYGQEVRVQTALPLNCIARMQSSSEMNASEMDWQDDTAIIGTCSNMCPDEERSERWHRKGLHVRPENFHLLYCGRFRRWRRTFEILLTQACV